MGSENQDLYIEKDIEKKSAEVQFLPARDWGTKGPLLHQKECDVGLLYGETCSL